MRFQQLVFRTTPHSLVEWLDGELEKRGIDCVYTHCILSILQEDSDDTEPDECIDVRNNQQKVYHKYGGPESLFSATKSKHQKWKTYSKQILLTGSISSCDVGISDLERKNRNAAINCLKSVSDDNTIEDLIEEVCLKLKNLKNVNALEKKDSVKSSNGVDKETAFYIPPSSPTDQVEKYFAAFPPLNNNFEEKNSSDEFIHVNAWYNNCLRKNKTIVQDIFKNSQINSENSRKKSDNFCSLKSIENIYQPDNKSLNRCKIHNTHKQDNNNLKFSDENAFTEISVKSNLGDISNSTLTNMLSKFKKESDENLFGHYTLNITTDKSNNATGKSINISLNGNQNDDNRLDSKTKYILESTSSCEFSCKKCKAKSTNLTSLFLHKCLNEDTLKPVKSANLVNFLLNKCLNEDTSKPVACSTKNLENVKNKESLSSQNNDFVPCKKFKSLKISDTPVKTNEFFGCESLDSTSENVDIKSCEENDDVSANKSLACPKSKRRKKSLSKDSCGTMKNDFSRLMFNNIEKQAEGKRKDFEHSEIPKKDTSDKTLNTDVEQLKMKNTKKRKNKSKLKKCCSTVEQKNFEFLKPKPKPENSNDIKLKDVSATEIISSKTDHIFNNEWLQDTGKEVSVKKLRLNVNDPVELEGKDNDETLCISQYTVKNAKNRKEKIYLHKDSLVRSNLYPSGEAEIAASAAIENSKDIKLKDVNGTEIISSKSDHIFNNECLQDTGKEVSVKKVPLNINDSVELEGKDNDETLCISQYTVKNANNKKEKIYLHKDSLERSNLYPSGEAEIAASAAIENSNDIKLKDVNATEVISSKSDHFNNECLQDTGKEVSVKKVPLNINDPVELEGKDNDETLCISQYTVKNAKNRKEKIYLHKDSLERSNLYPSGEAEIAASAAIENSNDIKLKDVNGTEIISSKSDHIFNNECLQDTGKEVSVKKVPLNINDSVELEGKDNDETLCISQYTVKNANNRKEEIYLHKDSLERSNLYPRGEAKIAASADENNSNKSKIANINRKTLIVKTTKSKSELTCKLPTLNEIPCRKLIFSFGNINLNKISTNLYYNFDSRRALSFFSENEIFNIITAGDLNEVNNFLSKFSTPRNKPVNGAQEMYIEPKQEANNYSLPSQKSSTNFGSRENIDEAPLLKISPSCSSPEICCSKLSASSSLKDIQVKESDHIYSLPNNHCNEVTFKGTNIQKKISNDNTSVFKDWDYNCFFDFNEEKSKSSSCFTSSDYFNVTYPSLSVSDSPVVKSISDVHPNKTICDEDTFSPGLPNDCYNEDKFVSPYITSSTDNFVTAIKKVLYNSEGEYISRLLENESKQIDSVENISDACSAFKPANNIKQNCIPVSSRKSSQNILRKAVNIDRIIQKINGKDRVASFEHLSFLGHPVDGQILSYSPVSFLGSTSNYSDEKLNTENVMTDSDWSEQFLMKKENLKSIWETKISCIDGIWGSPTKNEENKPKPISSNFDKDEIQEEFEKEQEELLRGLYSMPHLKEETDLTYSFEQNASNPVYGCPYKASIDLTNESLNTDEYSGTSSVHTMPAQTASKFSKSNNNLSFSFSEPSVEPVGSFSLDNCKNEAVDSQISCSDDFSDYVKNESYQESDFIDLSAFRGPYGSFSENRTNALECGGWSLGSDSYLLESEAFHNQSSSLQELNTMGTENDHFLYMPIDRQQFSSEDDEIAKLNATRWPTGHIRRRMKHKCPPFKRPCAFYMEGHCNRADCKFSHELSNITCRFWQEGSCFKGSTCPFLHGYAEEQKTDQHRSFHKREPEHNYSLDSEADFPSLSSSKSEKTVVVKSEPVDIVRVKGFKNSRQTNH